MTQPTPPTPPAGRPSWAGKIPADMTIDELRAARENLIAKEAFYRNKAEMLAAAIQAIDAQSLNRVGQAPDPQTLIPTFPVEAVEREI